MCCLVLADYGDLTQPFETSMRTITRPFAQILLTLIVAVFGAAPAFAEKDEKLTFDYQNVEFRVALRDIADRCDLNLVIPDALHGTTSFKLTDVTWRQAFQVMLQPVGYSYLEDGQIVKILAMEDFPDPSGRPVIVRRAPARGCWLDGFWIIPGVAIGFGSLVVLCHVFLLVGVLRDTSAGAALFAPRLIWALLVGVGGVVPLLGYWIIHHSTLAQNRKAQNRQGLSSSEGSGET